MSEIDNSNYGEEGVLTDISEVNPSVSLLGLDSNDPVTFLSMSDVGENGRILHSQSRPLKDVRNGFTRFEEKDVLFAKITPCMENGKGAFATNLINKHGFGSTEFHVLRANDNGDPEFIFHVTQNSELRSKAESFFSGSAGQQRVSSDFFSKYLMVIPSLPQQKKIARILTTVDSLIEKTEALIEKYKAIKQGMMHDLFTRGVDQNGKLRPPYEEAPHLYKESPLGWIPKEWAVKNIAKACSLVKDGTHLPPPRTKNGPLLLGVQNITTGNLQRTKSDTRVPWEFFHMMHRRWRIEVGDILLGIIGTVGSVSSVPNQFEPFTLHRNVAVIRGQKSIIRNPFLLHFARSQAFQGQLSNTSSQTAQPAIFLNQLLRLKVNMPSLKEQDGIVSKLDTIDVQMQLESDYLEKILKQKNGLMQDLLTGKVRVNADEVGEVTANV